MPKMQPQPSSRECADAYDDVPISLIPPCKPGQIATYDTGQIIVVTMSRSLVP